MFVLRKHAFTLYFTFAYAASIAMPARVATSAMQSFVKSLLTQKLDAAHVTTRMSNVLRFKTNLSVTVELLLDYAALRCQTFQSA